VLKIHAPYIPGSPCPPKPPDGLNSFLARSGSSLQRLEVTEYDTELIRTLHSIPSLVELRLHSPGDTRTFLDCLSVDLTYLPQLRRLELWAVDKKNFIEDGGKLLNALETRRRATGRTGRIQSVHIHFKIQSFHVPRQWRVVSHCGLLDRFRSLASEGMEFNFELSNHEKVRNISSFSVSN